MGQNLVYGLLGAFAVFCCVMAYLWHSKKIKELEEQASAELARLNKTLDQSVGQISVLEKQVQTLSQEKNKALQQYHSTSTLLTAANQAKEQQDSLHQFKVDKLQSNIQALEEKMNLAIGNYQAERRRNLITEKAYIQDALAQLTTIEQNLQASQQAFNKPSAEGTH